MAQLVGQRFGNYRLKRLLGEGGSAQVYLGQHVLLGTQAAIKVLHTHLSAREIERFCQEASTVSRLSHPHIVRLLEFDVQEGVPYLVMEYAPGGSLRQRHPEGVPLSLPTIRSYLTQLAEALTYAHAQHILHRDVKPENVVVGQQGQILLSDFGLALLAQRSSQLPVQEVVGTAAYLAPEQVQGRPRRASDQYALGIMAYEWLTGHLPFTGTLIEVVSQQTMLPPRPLHELVPTIGEAVEAVVLRALAKDPNARFTSVAAFASAFEQACQINTQPAVSSRRAPLAPGSPNVQPSPLRLEREGGRRSPSESVYALPTDPQEVQRLDFQHFMLRREMRGNYVAPLAQPTNILDVGCGTGRWVMEMAAEFPHAKVTGMDVQLPDSAAALGHGLERQPENVSFLEADVLKGLPFADASFDFVHLRLLFTAIPASGWPSLLDEIVRVLRPQGWIESVESWVNVPDGAPGSSTITEWINELLKRRGLDPRIARRMPELLRERRLEQITTYELPHSLPQSQRWKQVYSTLGLGVVEHFRPQIIAQGIVTTERYDTVAAQAQQEIQRSGALMWPTYLTFGQQQRA